MSASTMKIFMKHLTKVPILVVVVGKGVLAVVSDSVVSAVVVLSGTHTRTL